MSDTNGAAVASETEKPPAGRIAIVVLGMHRSGTSALTRMLSLLGAHLPEHLLGANPTNKAGHWEPQLLVNLHDRMLAEAGSRWDDWRAFDEEALPPGRLEHYQNEIARIIAEDYGDAPLIVLKDPRICRFVPLYERALAGLGIEPRYVLAQRNPLGVIASLATRDGMTPAYAGLLWLRHVLDGEAATRGRRRVFLSYEEFLDDWRAAARHLSEGLSINWPRPPQEAAADIENHLTRDLQHHAPTLEQLDCDPNVTDWIKEAYYARLKLAVAENDPNALEKLSHIRNEFDSASPLFGAAAIPEIISRERRLAEARRQMARGEEARKNDFEQLAHLLAEARSDTGLDDGGMGTARRKKAERNPATADSEARDSNPLDALVREFGLTRQWFMDQIAEAKRQADEAGRQAEQARAEVAQAKEQARNEAEARLADVEKRLAEAHGAARAAEEALSSRASEWTAQLAEAESRLQALQETLAAKSDELDAYRFQADAVDREREHARSEEKRLHDVLDAVYASTSWRLTKPIRGIKTSSRAALNGAFRSTYGAWHALPLPNQAKAKLKNAVFGRLPFLFSSTNAYRAWQNFNAPLPPVRLESGQSDAVADTVLPGPAFVPRLEAPALTDKPVRVVAFYLPQFHPIPENDEWWGEGFTEWTNVRPAKPQFEGHYQPHVPVELGYYDLRDKETQRKQIELAKLYGIEGFCFYFYWFGGKRLLETPLENWLADSSLDLPFCLCWANENWSRRWDGLDQEILIAQDYSPEDDLAFITEAARYLRDPRYIRVDGKPLLLVYRPSLLPNAKETGERWRAWCRESGVGEIFLAYTQSFENVDPSVYGFDAAVEFPPNNSAPPNVTGTVRPLDDDLRSTVYDWSAFPKRSESYKPRSHKVFRSVCPGWDNTARRRNGGTVFINNTPALYTRWLENAVQETVENAPAEERLVFVNAWNEWAEGAHLEPDTLNGYAYLQATRDVLVKAGAKARPRVVIVSHDAHPHGAQVLALNMARGFKELGFEPDLICLGDGPLIGRFSEVADLHRMDVGNEGETEILRRLAEIRRRGAKVAVANTTVSGKLVPLLKKAGFETISLIHEMPGVLDSYGLQDSANAIADHADRIVFPATVVQDGFETFIGRKVVQSAIRPQGLVRKNPFKGRREEAREIVCKAHDLPPHARIVLSVAYVDQRKGADLFVEVAERCVAAHPDTFFIWIGHTEREMEAKVRALIAEKGLAHTVRFIGFVEEPMAYYAAASVYALTSREDPFPNVVLESAEVEVPVVAFEGVTGAGEFIVEHGGRLASAFDVADFADKVGGLLHTGAARDLPQVPSMRQYLMDLLHQADDFPRVSVVLPNYNYAHHLPQRLESIFKQSFPLYELIVLDDASADGSIEVVRDLFSREDTLDCRLVVNQENSGSVFRQWKKGVDHCRGDIVWIAEADDFSDSAFVDELIHSFSDHAVVLSYSQSHQVDGDGKVLAGNYFAYTDDIGDKWRSDYVCDGTEEISQALAVKNTIPNVSAVLFRRAALEKAFLDLGDDLFEYRVAGDWLVYLKVLLQGRINYSSKSLNFHRRHVESVTKSGAAMRHFHEVLDAQEQARSVMPISPDTRCKADAWLEHVRRYLDISNAERTRERAN